MAFERVSFENDGEPEPQDPGERWLADVRALPSFHDTRGDYLLQILSNKSQDYFAELQAQRQRSIETTGVDIIERQFTRMRRVLLGDLID